MNREKICQTMPERRAAGVEQFFATPFAIEKETVEKYLVCLRYVRGSATCHLELNKSAYRVEAAWDDWCTRSAAGREKHIKYHSAILDTAIDQRQEPPVQVSRKIPDLDF